METRIIDSKKGFLWPADKLCVTCGRNIHLEKKEDIYKTGESLYYCKCKCGETHRIPADMIPAEIRNSL